MKIIDRSKVTRFQYICLLANQYRDEDNEESQTFWNSSEGKEYLEAEEELDNRGDDYCSDREQIALENEWFKQDQKVVCLSTFKPNKFK